MRQHLINLLFEEYKQRVLFEEMWEHGMDLKRITVKNWEIVMDIVGFPPDNYLDYDYSYIQERMEAGVPIAYWDYGNEIICRSYWEMHFVHVMNEILKEKQITVGVNGLNYEDLSGEKRIKEKLGEHVDWLYKQYEIFKRPR